LAIAKKRGKLVKGLRLAAARWQGRSEGDLLIRPPGGMILGAWRT
jgi:hypothetical protein